MTRTHSTACARRCGRTTAPFSASVPACSCSPAQQVGMSRRPPGRPAPRSQRSMCSTDSDLFAGLEGHISVWQHHTDEVAAPPPGFRVLARSAACRRGVRSRRAARGGARSSIPRLWSDDHPAGRILLENFLGLAEYPAPHSRVRLPARVEILFVSRARRRAPRHHRRRRAAGGRGRARGARSREVDPRSTRAARSRSGSSPDTSTSCGRPSGRPASPA